MKQEGVSIWRKVLKQLGAKFIIGVLALVPLGLTLWILNWLFKGINNILQPHIESVWENAFPGIGILALIVLIYLAGIIASNFIGKWIIKWGEAVLENIPMISQLYKGIKQILEGFLAPGKDKYMDVVIVEFPRKGMHSLGFITNKLPGKTGESMLSVYVPTSPNPTSGFLEIVSENDVVRTNLTVDSALKMIVSAGKASVDFGGKLGELS